MQPPPSLETSFAATNKRIENELKYYTHWANRSRTLYHSLNFAAIGFGALVPVVALLPPLLHIPTNTAAIASIAGICGAIATLLHSIDGLFKTRDTWVRSIATTIRLRSERHLREAKAGPYAVADDPDRLFAERVDQLVTGETQQWTATMTQDGKERQS